MIVTKYFAGADEILSSGACFKALYNALAHAYVTGIANTVYLTEERVPMVSMCNCVKSVMKYLSGVHKSSKMVTKVLDDLSIDEEWLNADPSQLPDPTYCFCLPSFVERSVILAAVYLFLEEVPDISSLLLKRMRHRLLTAQYSKAHFEAFYSCLQDELMHIRSDPTYDGYAGHFRPHRHKEEAGVPVSALFDVASTLCRNHPESVSLVLDVIKTAVAQEMGNVVEKAEARSHQLEESIIASFNASTATFASMSKPPKDMATTGQQTIFFYYLFNELNRNFNNSDKAAWIRLIHWATGRNSDSIKDHLNIDFGKKSVQKDLSVVRDYLQELFPGISQKIDNDRIE